MRHESREAVPNEFASSVFLFFFLFFLWLLLASSINPAELITGLVVALVVTLISRPHIEVFTGLKLTPSAVPAFISYLVVFVIELVRANLDMARRVLSPSLPLNPALVEVKTELKSPLGRFTLANSITLTPGTLSVDVMEDRLIVHWIEVPPGFDSEQATRTIAGKFERHLKGFLR